MANNEEVARLRAEVRKRQADATRKINRLKSQGAIIAGTGFDPRVPAERIGRYNANQLRSQLDRLNNFQNRNAQFVGLSEGVPITRQRAEQFLRAQRNYNTYIANYRSQFENIPVTLNTGPIDIRYTAQTVRERDARLAQKNDYSLFAAGRAANRPLYVSETEFSGVESPEALDTLEEGFARKMTPEFLAESVAKGRENARKALDIIGQSEISKQLDELNDFQFNVLWHEEELANALFEGYGFIQMLNLKDSAELEENAMNKVRKLIRWGRTIEPQAG